MRPLRARDRRRLMGGTYDKQEVTGDFRNAQGFFATFNEVTFKDCQMGQGNFSRSIFTQCVFENCKVQRVSFNSTRITDCAFVGCDLDQATFNAATIIRSKFVAGRAQYSEFIEASAIDVKFEMDLHGADLRFAEGKNLDYGDSDIWGGNIKFSCAQFKDARISGRMFQMFLALLATTKGNDELRAQVLHLVDPRYREVVGRMAMMEIE